MRHILYLYCKWWERLWNSSASPSLLRWTDFSHMYVTVASAYSYRHKLRFAEFKFNSLVRETLSFSAIHAGNGMFPLKLAISFY